jgi:hypothetical protein
MGVGNRQKDDQRKHVSSTGIIAETEREQEEGAE